MARGIQWKALSQAAKNGYSQESGIDKMSSACTAEHVSRRSVGSSSLSAHGLTVFPLRVSDTHPVGRRRRHVRVAVSPLIPNEVVVLLGPHHAGEGLSLNITQIVRHRHWADSVVELVGLFATLFDHVVKLLLVEVCSGLLGEAETHD